MLRSLAKLRSLCIRALEPSQHNDALQDVACCPELEVLCVQQLAHSFLQTGMQAPRTGMMALADGPCASSLREVCLGVWDLKRGETCSPSGDWYCMDMDVLLAILQGMDALQVLCLQMRELPIHQVRDQLQRLGMGLEVVAGAGGGWRVLRQGMSDVVVYATGSN